MTIFLVEMNIWRPSAHPNTSIRQSEVVQFHFKVRESQRPAGAGRVTRGRRSRDPRARVADIRARRNDYMPWQNEKIWRERNYYIPLVVCF